MNTTTATAAKVTAFAAGDRLPTVTLEVATRDEAVARAAELAGDFFYVAASTPAKLGSNVAARWLNGRALA